MKQPKIFRDRKTLDRLVNLRINGYAVSTLSIMFKCDKHSIRDQLDKYHIEPWTQIYSIERIVSEVLPEPKESVWVMKGDYKFNRGHNYSDYRQSPLESIY